MTQIDFAAAQADIALDPMAGTVAALNLQEGTFPVRNGANGFGVAHTQRGDSFAAQKGEFDRIESHARAHVSPTSIVVEKINIGLLALDLGTKTGYALRRRDGRITHGTEVFTPRSSWTPGQKWQRYRAWLSRMITDHAVGIIAFEDVKAHGKSGVLAAHAYGGYRAMLEMVADQHNIELVPVGVGVVKKHWTGKGNADKAAMVAQAKARGYRPETDNDADALAILDWAVARERSSGRG
ncbi:hypothetical protein RVU96_16825 [Bordetella avium]|uniref:hypothetical protein n=1 Tax=Bordetella avium TaxID=521 RepID=UPI000E0C4597|nr:hypothetical protein [Bordetella avium]RIQ11580.1 hypothetical protein D0432_16355 [Bordetella avium]RIQ44921.1 hypothetical protein D0845_17085 [Bordetella avium]RIQ49571.1 hypothetical protein D0844_16380 [Bordetella avium]RIQ55332.1 hypothetical protein D0841_16570 [Bordetella avium]RIQ58416.1 hypothetical protein D0842_16475 [Bordetella avium]